MLELRFGDRTEAIRRVFNHGDGAGGDAGVADSLGDREDHEEQVEEHGEAQ